MNIKNTKGKLNKYILVQIALVTLLLILFQSTFYKHKMNMLMYNSTLIIILCVIFYLEVKIQSKDKRIDELIKSEDELREEIFLASCDELTNLPNKEMFIKSLQKTIDKTIKTNSNEKIAVMFLDLDNFKKINDTLGHDYGDELLKIVAEILKFYVEEGNYISRIGGDEFLIFIRCDKDCNNVVNLCENIKGMFIEPLKIGNKYACTSVSIGISIFPQDSTDVNILIKNADIAMYKGKNSGKNSYCFFTNNMRQEMERKSEIEKYLRNALENNELQVYYQPQIHVSGKKLAGFEALLRWNSKELGWISPVEFIPIAEETSLIIPIGEWLIKTVCNQYVEWMKKGYAPFTIAINLSAVQIQNKDFGEKIRRIIKETNIDPKYIEFEIAETMLMESLECSIKLLKEFKELGVKVAIDNFGIGYSSFKHLKGLPINTIKIDKSFIDDIDLNSSDRDITHGIIKLAHKINMEVIAEGVVKEGQVSLLEHMECDKIQGYYFSRPLSLESAESMLESADHFFK